MNYWVINDNYDVLANIREDGIYIRKGKCNGCGKCCIALHPENRGEDGACKYLIDGKCEVHDIKKPIHCRMSPVSPDLHKDIPECGFSWVKV